MLRDLSKQLTGHVSSSLIHLATCYLSEWLNVFWDLLLEKLADVRLPYWNDLKLKPEERQLSFWPKPSSDPIVNYSTLIGAGWSVCRSMLHSKYNFGRCCILLFMQHSYHNMLLEGLFMFTNIFLRWLWFFYWNPSPIIFLYICDFACSMYALHTYVPMSS